MLFTQSSDGERGNKTLIQKYYAKINSVRMRVWDCNLVMNLHIFLCLEMSFEALFRLFKYLLQFSLQKKNYILLMFRVKLVLFFLLVILVCFGVYNMCFDGELLSTYFLLLNDVLCVPEPFCYSRILSSISFEVNCSIVYYIVL